MAFRYALRWADGSDAGEASFLALIRPGDRVHVHGNELVRVRAVVPRELIGEFVDGGEVDGLLEIERG